MRFLADENFPMAAIAALEADGLDIASVGRSQPGMADAEVLAWAGREGRVLLTFDKDFGELARRATREGLGIILFRIPAPRRPEGASRLVALIRSRSDWTGHFSVVEAGRIRMRPLGRSD